MKNAHKNKGLYQVANNMLPMLDKPCFLSSTLTSLSGAKNLFFRSVKPWLSESVFYWHSTAQGGITQTWS